MNSDLVTAIFKFGRFLSRSQKPLLLRNDGGKCAWEPELFGIRSRVFFRHQIILKSLGSVISVSTNGEKEKSPDLLSRLNEGKDLLTFLLRRCSFEMTKTFALVTGLFKVGGFLSRSQKPLLLRNDGVLNITEPLQFFI